MIDLGEYLEDLGENVADNELPGSAVRLATNLLEISGEIQLLAATKAYFA